MSAVVTAGTTPWCPPDGRRRPSTRPWGLTAADTSMATESSLSACAGHRPSGRRSFREQRTVNPLTGQSADRSNSLQLPQFLLQGRRATVTTAIRANPPHQVAPEQYRCTGPRSACYHGSNQMG